MIIRSFYKEPSVFRKTYSHKTYSLRSLSHRLDLSTTAASMHCIDAIDLHLLISSTIVSFQLHRWKISTVPWMAHIVFGSQIVVKKIMWTIAYVDHSSFSNFTIASYFKYPLLSRFSAIQRQLNFAYVQSSVDDEFLTWVPHTL